jgi:hypothetical protein
MLRVTRRGLLAVGGAGAASLAVSACGAEDDPRAEGRDADLLDSALSAEAILKQAYGTVKGGGDEQAVGRQFTQASTTRLNDLERLAGGPAKASASTASNPNGLSEAQDSAIAAYRDLVRFGSTTDLRSTAIQFLTQVAGEQATIRGLQDQDQSPVAFVTGLQEKPYIASNDTTTSTTSTTSSSTTSTSTTTTTGG